MEVFSKDKSGALQALVESLQKGQEKRIRQSLESLLTINALESDPEQIELLKNFANSIKFDREMFILGTGAQKFRVNLMNYCYQLD
ncbi:hypothetical protein [Desulfosporosinus shakirovi]|uniref:hypothetical protein n=1 Tax=Desulfosporosinus shakirovi TaxID=2885154 RepID=UPI001E51ACD5|nr:hypothetical protein [Desulfosporosinus sp. SRJS8]MCB8817141.1 hypothetical protein [Desulfosporosinus sp. SRJS8]